MVKTKMVKKNGKNKNWQKVKNQKYQKQEKQENLLDSNVLILNTTAVHVSILKQFLFALKIIYNSSTYWINSNWYDFVEELWTKELRTSLLKSEK